MTNCMRSRIVFFLVVLLIVPLAACSKIEARIELKKLGIAHTPDEFLSQIKTGNLERVNLFLAAGMDPDTTFKDGTNCLAWAVVKGETEIVKSLIRAGAAVNSDITAGNNLLMIAISGREVTEKLAKGGGDYVTVRVDAGYPSGDPAKFNCPRPWRYRGTDPKTINMVRLLLDNGATQTRYVPWDWTPLMLAVERCDPEIARLLLERGADVNAKQINGRPALMEAIRCNNRYELVPLLLDYGADPNAVEDGKWGSGETAFSMAIYNGDFEMVNLLLDRGALIREGPTVPLLDAMENTETVKLLLLRGADVNEKRGDGFTALMSAAASGKIETMKLLLEKRADVNARDKDGWTPLMHAALSCQANAVTLLLKAGANPIQEKDAEQTALVQAILRNDVKSVRMLLEKGLDVNGEILSEHTPLTAAAGLGHLEIVKVLLEKGADINRKMKSTDKKPPGYEGTALTLAVTRNHVEVAKYLINNGCDVSTKTWSGIWAFKEAIEGGHTDLVRLFIAKGTNVNAIYDTWDTPLAMAAWKGRIDMMKFLIREGSDLNLTNARGETALVSAAAGGHIDTVKFLISEGAAVNTGSSGRTPLTYAVTDGHTAIVKFLLANGADVKAKQFDGQTALSLAICNGDEEIIKLLKDAGAKE
jgi:ankyrin repeat protein